MVKITVDEDCGNAPKKLLLRDFNIAVVQNDSEFISRNVADAIRWDMVGDKVLEGKGDVAAGLEQVKRKNATELTLKNIITHGNTGAVDGLLRFEDGRSYAFCDVYRFSSSAKDAKIKEITSYVIAL